MRGGAFWWTLMAGAVLGITVWNLLLALIFKPWRPRVRGLEGVQDWGGPGSPARGRRHYERGDTEDDGYPD